MNTAHCKNEYVRYAANGVCLVENIKLMDTPDRKEQKSFYILKPVGDPTSTIYVPADNQILTARMQHILDKQEIDTLILSIKEQDFSWINDRKLRAQIFHDMLKRCQQQELLQLISCIYLKKQELTAAKKKLSSSDEAILRQAEKLIEDEFSFVLGFTGQQVGQYIRQKLGIEENNCVLEA